MAPHSNCNRCRLPITRALLLAVALLAVGCSSCGSGGNTPEIALPTELPEFDAQRAFADLEHQCSLGPRAPGSLGHQGQLDWMVTTLTPLAEQLVSQPFSAPTVFGGPYDFTNLIAVFSAAAPGPITMIGAHWDTRPVADQDPDPDLRGQPILGANDGAAGVAILLELARIFSVEPPPAPVYLAFFDAEDSGQRGSGLPYSGFCIGSAYMAQNWPLQLDEPDRVVVLDLVGGQSKHNERVPVRTDLGGNDYFDLRIELGSFDAAPQLVNRIWTLAELLGHEAFERSTDGWITDDHVPFINAGIPAVDVIDFVPPVWHTADDVPEYCSPDALHQVGETMLALVYSE